MMAGAEKLFHYNTIEVPTVVGLLKNILTQYPDNGQIIKELIQNAEDAKACRVDVVHDTRTLDFPETHQDVQRFLKGPALCLYNDAVFSEEDWHGVRKLSDSIKKDDPLRVGQFGLGFKSIFHLTDYITILSGSWVLFMDPCEPEARMCRSVTLSALGKVLPASVSLKLWGTYLTPQHLAAGIFPATVFWFPLRQKPSQLSKTVYSWDHVKRLFDSFSVEAPVCLTFLKALEQVSLRRVVKDPVSPVLVHQVELKGPTLSAVQKERRELRQRLQECGGCPNNSLTCHYHVTIQSTKGTVVTQQTMLVLHYLPGQQDISRLKYEGNESHRYMPLVGVAVPTDPTSTSWAQGCLFTFLPLPIDPANTTGLPVQVNAYFTLDQNRRHVKWRTDDTSKEPDVIWNEELVSRVVLEAYHRLLLQVHSQAVQGISHPQVWYSLLPNLSTTTGRWERLARELWKKILTLPILHSQMQGFKTLQCVITDDSLSSCSSQVAKCVREVLNHHKKPLVTLPAHVTSSLRLLNSSPETVTPQLIRDCLRLGVMRPEWDRLTLLEYVTSDIKYQDLSGVPLLPLSNGLWTTFSCSSQQVYICTADQAKALWGLGSCILQQNLPSVMLQRLNAVAQTGTTQLRQFSAAQHGLDMLSQSVQQVQKCVPTPQQLQAWLEQVWSLLQQLSLNSVAHLPLLPSCPHPSSPTALLPLTSTVIVQNPHSLLPDAAVQALKLLGVSVVPQLPQYVRHHQLHPYLYTSDGRGVNLALAKMISTLTIQNLAHSFNAKSSSLHREALVNVLDPNNLQSSVITFLAKLNIFKSIGRDGAIVDDCVERVKNISPHLTDFPVNFPVALLTQLSARHQQLAQVVGAKQLSKEELCLLALNNRYSECEISKLALYILNDWSLIANKQICHQLQVLRFVPDENGILHLPGELYNPEDPDSDALIEEDLIPSNRYRQHLSALSLLGLRKVVDLPQHLLVRAITHVQATSLTDQEKAKKSAALLRLLEQRQDCKKVCKAVQDVAFIYGVKTKPSHYPAGLGWATKRGLLSPASLRNCSKYQDVLGSVMQLVECSHLLKVTEGFGWNKDPNAEYFLNHFKNILAVCQPSAEGYFEIIKKTYKHLLRILNTSEVHHLKSLSSLPCVFTEYGFKPPHQVYLTTTRDDLQLLPYMHPLPYELREWTDLFKFLGCFVNQSKELYLELLKEVKEHHSTDAKVNVNHDRKLLVSVLEKLEIFVSDIPPSQLLLPVENEDDSLELVEKEQCSYSDQDCDWLSSDDLGVRIVHQCVGPRLAHGLGVRQLRQHLASGGEAVMEWGQREPLTTRLHNLLRQYRDGVAVMKELVQNADDAGATRVSFLYDERLNDDARTRLLSPQLEQCQGPALWAYNNATFTENDFHNLREVGGGTKEFQSTKIGKFGLGFCSVYNLTDVPSFVSGSSYVIFDPHLNHLGPENKTPGLRYNFEKKSNSRMLMKLQGQFKPFDNVFDCKIQDTKEYDGTLFRFPLRTPSQAAKSKISQLSYGRTDIMQLLKMFRKVVGELMLFTQNIKEIKVFHLACNASSSTEKQLLFESSFVPVNVPLVNKLQETPMKKAGSLYTMKQSSFKWTGELYQETTLSNINVRSCPAWSEVCEGKEESETVTWLTSWHSGKDRLCRLAERLGGRALPLAAVSAPVIQESNGWKPRCLSDMPLGFYTESHLHCFLPLPVKTPLPVQVNGFFEVASDRTALLSQTSDDRQDLSWNTILVEDAVSAAYHTLLEKLISLGQSTNIPYYTLWPLATDHNDCHMTALVHSFYHSLVNENWEVFCSSSGWHPLTSSLFLDDNFYQKQIGKIAYEYMEKMLSSSGDQHMIELPSKIKAGFQNAWISKFCISQDAFYMNYFIPNVSHYIIAPEKRDKLTLYIMDTSHTCVENLKDVVCIPSRPNGKLRSPADLIEPRSSVADMYTELDERFPHDNFIETRQRKGVLLDLGMKSRNIPAEWVEERTCSVVKVSCSECALQRSNEILQYIASQNVEKQNVISSKIQALPFLPVMDRPCDWQYVWKGEQIQGTPSKWCCSHSNNAPKSHLKTVTFAVPSHLCLSEFKELVGSSHLVISPIHGKHHNKLQVTALKKLGLVVHNLQLPIQSILNQLCVFTSTPLHDKVNIRCHAIYEHLETFLQQRNPSSVAELQGLRNKKILLTKEHEFVEPELFAIFSETNCAPDLYSASMEGLDKYKMLMITLGITTSFTYNVVLRIILSKKDTYGREVLNDAEVLQMSKLLGELFKVRNTDPLNDQGASVSLHLPDAKGYLHPVNKLCFDDGARLTSGEFLCLHKNIKVSKEMLEWLGITSKTRKRLENSSHRMHFGQSEPLTTRLRNILQDYPCDASIMKELLQNADDSGATEVAFINDQRHLPTERLFDEKWAPLQGPALSVYNNKGFTARDLQSIQDLGNSTKKEDPASTGQYGIGFNAVYHLTDAPSFLTQGPEVPGGSTICMFDPHCHYDTMATAEKPGVQLMNLDELRVDHPDSFIGYLEKELLGEEGTVFRLPLRSSTNSEISKNVMTAAELKVMLQKFQSEMSKCMLFLRSVRKISILTVDNAGTCHTDYFVQALFSKKSNLSSILLGKKQNNFNLVNLYALEMVRESYKVKITDSIDRTSSWYVVQQLGAVNDGSAPEIVKEAFNLGTLSLLPHASVALLLNSNMKTMGEPFTTSCYLPLPSASGLPFSINGHFALTSSRTDLWSGTGDAKAMWNQWLMKEVLVPAATCALDYCRTTIFPENEGDLIMTEMDYHAKIYSFQKRLPNIHDVRSEKWKNFTTWFYEYVRENHLHFFEVFIPESDKKGSEAARGYHCAAAYKVPEEPRRGKLLWHAFREMANEFPIYFGVDNALPNVVDTFKRLGMKIGSNVMWERVCSADPQYEYPVLTPTSALTFLTTWNKNFPDNCKPLLGHKIEGTPFLKPGNVCEILRYISEEWKNRKCVLDLPLLLTNNNVLRHISESEPVFISSYCFLLPSQGEEFVQSSLVSEINKHIGVFEAANVLKQFTTADLGDRLSSVLNASYHSQDTMMKLKYSPNIPNERWVKNVWDLIIEEIKRMFTEIGTNSPNTIINWEASKQHILQTLGNWALYPVTVAGTVNLISISSAWSALYSDGFEPNSIFKILPVPQPCPYIPANLKLAATVDDPKAVLEVLYFHRNEIADFMSKVPWIADQKMRLQMDARDVLKYLGRHCKQHNLSQTKISSLKIFKDQTGHHCSLINKKLIVPKSIDLTYMKQIALDNDYVILKQPNSENILALYNYIDAEFLTEDLDVYSKFILPNFEYIEEGQKIAYLKKLRDLVNVFHDRGETNWDRSQAEVVSVLRKTKILELNGRLETTDNFYDSLNFVFSVMKVSNVTGNWADSRWRNFLILAGMVHTITPQKYLEFARSLRAIDPEVEAKSKALIKHLESSYLDLHSVISDIRDIEFLVPYKIQNSNIFEDMLPHFKTHSGLVNFSKSADSKFGQILWSTVSLLPPYATSSSVLMKKLSISDTAPEEKVLQHITNFCQTVNEAENVVNEEVMVVMEDIYEHLMKSERACESLKQSEVPVIHIPDHRVFIPANLMVENLEEEIIPYLYKAPTRYGKYYDVFKKLGMEKQASCDTYALVLKRIYGTTQQQELHPGELEFMKMALKGMLKYELKLQNLSVDVLYLPTRKGTLRESSKMFVADNEDLLMATQDSLKEPLFMGFASLKINKDNGDFVKRLPERLRPRFVSDIVQEILVIDGVEEVSTPLLVQVREGLSSLAFKSAILRVLNHFKMRESLGLSEKEVKDIMTKLSLVVVKQLKEIRVTLKFHEDEIGSKVKQFHLQQQNEENVITLYISQYISSQTLFFALNKIYKKLLDVKCTEIFSGLNIIMYCITKPHDIHRHLDDANIKEYGAQSSNHKLYSTDVGSYLEERFLHLLDNSFGQFHEGEIVCLKKYVLEDGEEGREDGEDDNTFIIVQVICLVKKSSIGKMMDIYKVSIGMEDNSFSVKAHSLYMFVRKTSDALVLFSQPREGTEEEREKDMPEEELRRKIRQQVKEIWQVEDERERRHLLRRLMFQWHPDKNPHQVELCTRLVQYLQSLVGRLERGETIPEDDCTGDTAPGPSRAYEYTFRPPPPQYSSPNGTFGGSYERFYSGSSSRSFHGRSSQRTGRRKGDRPESCKWWRHADHDLEEAGRRLGGPSCYVIYFCHQAAEKFLKACLYRVDRDAAAKWQRDSLTMLCHQLSNTEALDLVSEVEARVGQSGRMRYPGFHGCPCDLFNEEDAQFVLGKVRRLKEILMAN